MSDERRKVLIVDDNPENLNVLYGVLEKDFNVFAAEKGQLVQEMAIKHKPDIIVLDILMPGMDGYQVCQKLKKDKKTCYIPIVFMSALSETIDIVKGFEVGGIDYITKPYKKEVVLKRLSTHIELSKSRERILDFNNSLQLKVEEKTKELKEKIDEITRINLILKESEDKYHKLFTSAPEAILIIQVSTSEVLDANLPALELFGYTNDEIIGKLEDDLFGDRKGKNDLTLEDEGSESAETLVFRNRLIRKNGKEIEAEMTSRLILIEGEMCQQVVIRDITTRIKYEQGLKKAKQKADELSALKSGFLANMAHELRTPLIGILGYSEILNQELTDDMHHSMIEGILNTGQRLLKTLNLLIDLAMIGEKNHHFKIEPMNIVETVEEVCEKYLSKAQVKEVDLVKQFSDSNIMIHADERMIFSLFCNLLGNAVKFTEEGKITVSVDAKSDEKKQVRVIIEDTGIGISQDKINMIFEEFRQESEGVSRDYQGLGLGLTLSKKFAEYNNGKLDLQSEKGRGTKVSVTFDLLENY